ncbi:GSCFA domain-containing protein [Sphingobium rhizovicinum]|uniref:GSCFA domain-containing protein n=1 Tax=Sphingobium rhizovicinum TaxID=432308 RepID=A0ABV7NEG2_9SPHN
MPDDANISEKKRTTNPYKDLPERAFWKPSIADKSMFDIEQLWSPKFNITPHSRVSTFGSCFAQHIGNALRQRGYNWLITETAPYGLSADSARTFNYGIFSARTANIYTTSLLRQWTSWAIGSATPPEEVWEKDGRYYDPFRPLIEPQGFASPEEVRLSRLETIRAFRDCIEKSHYFVFTLGLTESWFNAELGYEYPMCPGTAAGAFDGDVHVFRNQEFNDVRNALAAAIRMMHTINPKLRILLTVSPVPLTATKSDQHVLVATMYSKSVLRAVAGQTAMSNPLVDYFPSYEIINSAVFKGTFFDPNQRSVNKRGVAFVMDHFFNCLTAKFGAVQAPVKAGPTPASNDDVVCEEELLGAFGGKK